MDHIRGKDVADARAILTHKSRASASDISKLLESAVANAENNFELDPEELRIGRAWWTRAPSSSVSARAPRGVRRAINKRTSHMTSPHTHREGGLMSQKVYPELMRVGYIHDWKSTWFSEKEFADYLLEDIRIREHIDNKLAHAGLRSITIKKNKGEVEVNIHTARPGIVIGKSGSEVDALRKGSTR